MDYSVECKRKDDVNVVNSTRRSVYSFIMVLVKSGEQTTSH